MNNKKSVIVTTVIIIAILLIGGLAYVAMGRKALNKPMAQETTNTGLQTAPGDHPEEDHEAGESMGMSRERTIAWKFTEAAEVNGMPHTKVEVVVDDKTYSVGTFTGSCSQIGASGGIDGKGLLAGELSAAQCWFAGGGDEIGVFAEEDGSAVVMVGALGEGEEGSPLFRGDFKIRSDIKL